MLQGSFRGDLNLFKVSFLNIQFFSAQNMPTQELFGLFPFCKFCSVANLNFKYLAWYIYFEFLFSNGFQLSKNGFQPSKNGFQPSKS